MGFTALWFLLFLAILFPLYFLTKKEYRWVQLLIGSIVFYLLCSYKSFIFLLFSTLSIYFFANLIRKNKSKEKERIESGIDVETKKELKKKNKKIRKLYLAFGIISIVIVLVLMKYMNFIIDNVNLLATLFKFSFKFENVNWLLPLGISFYTFQAIGYLVDVYWGKYECEKNFFKFLLFMIFFPKIMQGPIIRYDEIHDSLFLGIDFEYNRFVDGLKRVIWGYFKKMVIADCLIVLTKYAFGNISSIYGFELLITVVCYFIYDYCDFSGYMDIACGISYSLGVKLPENFNHPYFAISIDDYWRRWHMTLGTWFKDYLFYPLSISKFSLKLGKKTKKIFGNFSKKIPGIVGLLIVWFTTGLWHGASWNYILWGLYFGLIIIFSIICEPLFNKFYDKFKIKKESWWILTFKHIRTLFLLAIGKILFETNSINSTLSFIKGLFNFNNYFEINAIDTVLGWPSFIVAMILSIVVLIVDLIQEKKPNTTFIEKTRKKHIIVQWSIWILLIVCIVWFGYYGSGLPKFEFGYMRF